jgi:hypothetical protein
MHNLSHDMHHIWSQNFSGCVSGVTRRLVDLSNLEQQRDLVQAPQNNVFDIGSCTIHFPLFNACI